MVNEKLTQFRLEVFDKHTKQWTGNYTDSFYKTISEHRRTLLKVNPRGKYRIVKIEIVETVIP